MCGFGTKEAHESVLVCDGRWTEKENRVPTRKLYPYAALSPQSVPRDSTRRDAPVRDAPP